MKRTTLVAAACLASLIPFVSSTTAANDRSETIAGAVPYQPRLILLQTPRLGVLQNRRSYRSDVRHYTNEKGGNPYDTTSALPYGAPTNAEQDFVIVRPREAIPYIAISPWDPITDRTIDELERNYPWIRRTESIRQDLVHARNQYLRERGYIGAVRGFRNPRAGSIAKSSTPPQVFIPTVSQHGPDAEPQLVIVGSHSDAPKRIIEERLNPASIIRANEDTSSDD